jgi:hypothetical protein
MSWKRGGHRRGKNSGHSRSLKEDLGEHFDWKKGA